MLTAIGRYISRRMPALTTWARQPWPLRQAFRPLATPWPERGWPRRIQRFSLLGAAPLRPPEAGRLPLRYPFPGRLIFRYRRPVQEWAGPQWPSVRPGVAFPPPSAPVQAAAEPPGLPLGVAEVAGGPPARLAPALEAVVAPAFGLLARTGPLGTLRQQMPGMPGPPQEPGASPERRAAPLTGAPVRPAAAEPAASQSVGRRPMVPERPFTTMAAMAAAGKEPSPRVGQVLVRRPRAFEPERREAETADLPTTAASGPAPRPTPFRVAVQTAGAGEPPTGKIFRTLSQPQAPVAAGLTPPPGPGTQPQGLGEFKAVPGALSRPAPLPASPEPSAAAEQVLPGPRVQRRPETAAPPGPRPGPQFREAEEPARPLPARALAERLRPTAGPRQELVRRAPFRPIVDLGLESDRGVAPPEAVGVGWPATRLEPSGQRAQAGVIQAHSDAHAFRPLLIMAKAAAGGPSVTTRPFELVRQVGLSQGRPMPSVFRKPMETVFGRPLGHVQLHTDEAASRAAKAAGAEAFTLGRRVYFAAGRFQEDSAGAGLLGHELTHVIQQADSPQAAVPQGAAARMSLKAGPARLAKGSPAERQAEETELAIQRLFETKPRPMVLRKALPGAAPEEGSSLPGLEPQPVPGQLAAASPLPTARIIQARAEAGQAGGATMPERGAEGPQDVRRLAEEVYRLIKSKLRVERERIGLR